MDFVVRNLHIPGDAILVPNLACPMHLYGSIISGDYISHVLFVRWSYLVKLDKLLKINDRI